MGTKLLRGVRRSSSLLLSIFFLVGVALATPRNQTDRDNDGLRDSRERTLGTNPRKADTDGDFLYDGAEVSTFRTNPLKRRTRGRVLDGNADSDRDGIANEDEDDAPGSRRVSSNRDADGDGIPDEDEDERGFNPFRRDSDGDGIDDGDEDDDDSSSSASSSSSSRSSSSSSSSSSSDDDDDSGSSSSRGR
jgi:hypothetical protein